MILIGVFIAGFSSFSFVSKVRGKVTSGNFATCVLCLFVAIHRHDIIAAK